MALAPIGQYPPLGHTVRVAAVVPDAVHMYPGSQAVQAWAALVPAVTTP